MAAHIYLGFPNQEANEDGAFFPLNISGVVQSAGLGVNTETCLGRLRKNSLKEMGLLEICRSGS